ncbi:HAMP domain-containing protein [bacterium]|nr:HAMP domain-containing protein [bacterium]
MSQTNPIKKLSRPGRLQWQLVRAYTLSLTLLVAILELLLFAVIFLPTASYLRDPELIVREVLEGADAAALLLDADPPRLAELTAELQAATGEIVIDPQPPGLGLMFYIQGPPWAQIAVADQHGRVLACSPAETWQVGEPLAEQLPAAEAGLVEQAAGGDAAWQSDQLPPQGLRTVIAAPVETADNRQLGVLYVQHEVPFDWWAALHLLWSYLAPPLFGTLLLALAVGLFVGWIGARGIVRRFRAITRAAEHWRSGEFQERIPPLGRDELGQVALQLNDMAGQLDGLLTRQREYAAATERSKLARDLHDTVKQQVFATALELATVQAKQPTMPEEARVHLARAAEMVQQVQTGLSAIVAALRTGADQPAQDLPALLRATLTPWSRQTGIAATLSCEPLPLIPWEQALPLVRILQGTLANTARHSGATEVRVELRWLAGRLELSIADNGRGFVVTPELLANGGLAMLNERAASLLGGRFTVQARPGQGTLVVVCCQIEEA